jgi:hypothetical protein
LKRSSGGPDVFGYRWIDSDEPGGPEFLWQDITGIGTPVILEDDDFTAVPLPFVFPFYGVNKTLIRICSNGYLTFGLEGQVWNNSPIPALWPPNNFIAPFWDDLDPELGGSIHYYHDTTQNQFLVQYTDIQQYGGSAPYTFQAILYPSGSIIFKYHQLLGDVTSATVGVEDHEGSDGLQVVFNGVYLHDEMAVLIEDPCPWLTENPPSGMTYAGGDYPVAICVDPGSLTPGEYSAQLVVNSNDPEEPQVVVPVAVIVSHPDAVDGEEMSLPEEFRLLANRPNPFNLRTTIRYELPLATGIRLKIYDVAGRRVRVLEEDPYKSAGRHGVVWDGRDDWGGPVSSGVYFFQLEAGSFRQTRRMVLLK